MSRQKSLKLENSKDWVMTKIAYMVRTILLSLFWDVRKSQRSVFKLTKNIHNGYTIAIFVALPKVLKIFLLKLFGKLVYWKFFCDSTALQLIYMWSKMLAWVIYDPQFTHTDCVWPVMNTLIICDPYIPLGSFVTLNALMNLCEPYKALEKGCMWPVLIYGTKVTLTLKKWIIYGLFSLCLCDSHLNFNTLIDYIILTWLIWETEWTVYDPFCLPGSRVTHNGNIDHDNVIFVSCLLY